MKVAFVNQPWDTVVLPVQSGSIAIWTYEVARRLVPSCDVIIYARRNRHQKQVEGYEGVQYRRVSVATIRVVNKFLKLFSKIHNNWPFFSSRLYCLGYALRVAMDLKEQQCDVVHIPNFSQFVPIIRAFNPSIKIVLHMHCEWLTQLDPAMIARRLSQVDLVVGCSEYITEKIRKRFPQFASRCQTVFNGVDVEHFLAKTGISEIKDNSTKRILFVGRISPEKGLHVLLDAFQTVAAHYPQAQLEIAGPQKPTPIEFLIALSDDPKISELASFAPESYFAHLQGKLSPNTASQISFSGHVQHLELPDYYRKADVLINPSFSEAFGMSLVEAMAAGVPVIATRVGGMTEIVEEGRNGLLVESGNASALAEAILQLLSDDDLRESMGKAGHQRSLELFSWERIAENLLNQYRHISESQEQIPLESFATPIL